MFIRSMIGPRRGTSLAARLSDSYRARTHAVDDRWLLHRQPRQEFHQSEARAGVEAHRARKVTIREIPIGDLSLYSYDFDSNYPPPAVALKEAIAGVDAVLFVTPEYNRSIPGALKNAIDWASRPWGKNSFHRKPSGVIGTSPGKIGTAVGQQHLRSILAFCNSPLMNSIEAYIQFEPGLITDEGEVTNAATVGIPAQLHAGVLCVHRARYTAIPRANS